MHIAFDVSPIMLTGGCTGTVATTLNKLLLDWWHIIIMRLGL